LRLLLGVLLKLFVNGLRKIITLKSSSKLFYCIIINISDPIIWQIGESFYVPFVP
jgi:hypothetical protein